MMNGLKNIKTHKIFDIKYNGSGLCVVAHSKNLKLTTTLDRAITQNPCYVPLNLENENNRAMA
jgi:hypothetical protein